MLLWVSPMWVKNFSGSKREPFLSRLKFIMGVQVILKEYQAILFVSPLQQRGFGRTTKSRKDFPLRLFTCVKTKQESSRNI